MSATGTGRRWVVRFWPARRQARRWEARNRSCRTTTALSHREVRFAAQRRSGLRSFPSHRKVRLTAQQAPTASPGLRLEHGLVEFCLGKQTLQPRVLLFQLLEPFGLCGLWPTADFVYMPP
jgi:hypothetical protein